MNKKHFLPNEPKWETSNHSSQKPWLKSRARAMEYPAGFANGGLRMGTVLDDLITELSLGKTVATWTATSSCGGRAI